MILPQNPQIPAVIVLGATGRLGGILRRHWAGGRDPGTLWLARDPGRAPGSGLVACDPLGDPQGLARRAQGAQAVLCLAGITPAAAARGAAFEEDARLALAAMAAAEAAGAHTFLCSSAAVYGRAEGLLEETAAPTPVAPYGQSKAAMEAAALAQAARTGQGVTILRIANVAGADAILGGWREGFALDAYPDGTTPARSYIGAATLARVLATLMGLRDLPQLLNIAAPGVVEMGALLDAAGLPWAARPAPDTAIARVELFTQRLTALVPLEPATAEGLVAEWQADKRAGQAVSTGSQPPTGARQE
ncbi:MAG: NAD-dependent epimerase [Rhodobacteraceae bacterium]|nr:NAD-dependent epimerase [Paracoccaceae bacterium]MAY47667.1 NAD-dependent epimerase [Paracoccaceae bacterium]